MRYTLITGACGGLGGAFTEELASRGEPLLLTGRSEERLAALASELAGKYPSLPVKYAACDLADEASRRAFFERIDGMGLEINRFVSVAGIDTQMAFERYDESKLVRQTRVNFEGAVSFFRAVLARAPLDGSTELVAVGSVSGISPMPYFALYSATKKALEQFLAALRFELKGRAKVTCVLPGGIPTREDIKENIASHGFFGRVSAKSPQAVVRASLGAVKRNRRRLVVGGWNKVISFVSRLTPAPLRMRVIARLWKRTEKDFY